MSLAPPCSSRGRSLTLAPVTGVADRLEQIDAAAGAAFVLLDPDFPGQTRQRGDAAGGGEPLVLALRRLGRTGDEIDLQNDGHACASLGLLRSAWTKAGARAARRPAPSNSRWNYGVNKNSDTRQWICRRPAVIARQQRRLPGGDVGAGAHRKAPPCGRTCRSTSPRNGRRQHRPDPAGGNRNAHGGKDVGVRLPKQPEAHRRTGLQDLRLRLGEADDHRPGVAEGAGGATDRFVPCGTGGADPLPGGSRGMVLLERIELSTSPLPRECSTTELQQRRPGKPRVS